MPCARLTPHTSPLPVLSPHQTTLRWCRSRPAALHRCASGSRCICPPPSLASWHPGAAPLVTPTAPWRPAGNPSSCAFAGARVRSGRHHHEPCASSPAATTACTRIFAFLQLCRISAGLSVCLACPSAFSVFLTLTYRMRVLAPPFKISSCTLSVFIPAFNPNVPASNRIPCACSQSNRPLLRAGLCMYRRPH